VNDLSLFLPCAAGVQDLLALEVERITGAQPKAWRAGVALRGSWRDALLLNLHSRLAQRVLVQLAHHAYRSEEDLYNAAGNVAWEAWFGPQQTFKVELTAQHSPLQSLNFATLRIKDAIADRFRAKFVEDRMVMCHCGPLVFVSPGSPALRLGCATGRRVRAPDTRRASPGFRSSPPGSAAPRAFSPAPAAPSGPGGA
jgi:23S rRNA G2445 N2-methylase RlmL